MRSEQEMWELILGVARRDDRVRAVLLGGSRNNSQVPKDLFQDYDVVYVVPDIAPFRANPHWVDVFGRRLIQQLPEEVDLSRGWPPCDPENCYGYLMQFDDGNRIDLRLMTLSRCLQELETDTLNSVLLDKDGALPSLPPPTDRPFWVKRPTAAEFAGCCNEFWWVQGNVAKGLWRRELPYALGMMNLTVRPELTTLLSWYVGCETGFSRSVGKCGKYLEQLLPDELWKAYLRTFAPAEIDALWDATEAMCALFDRVARQVAASLGYSYNVAEADGSRLFLRTVRALPRDAREIL